MTSPNLDIQALLRHEPGVRALARDLVGPGDRADDLVQDTWMVALCQGSNARDLGSWLRGVVRNLAGKSARGEGRRRNWEQASAKEANQPSAASILEREALRRDLFDAIWQLGEPARTTLLLRYFEGLPPREIARRMEVPVETVRTRIKRALSQVRETLGGSSVSDSRRRQVATGLLGLAFSGPGASIVQASRRVIEGSLIMATKTKLVLSSLALLALIPLAWMMWADDTSAPLDIAPTNVRTTNAAAPTDALSNPPLSERSERVSSEPFVEPQLKAAKAAPVATELGHLRVTVIRAALKKPLSQCDVSLTAVGERAYYRRYRWQRTDAQGATVYTDLKPGKVYLSTVYGGFEIVNVEAGKTLDVSIALKPGAIVKGKVVDAKGRAVKGASIFLDDQGFNRRGLPITTSQEDGSFFIGEVSDDTMCRLCARAPGYIPSNQSYVDLGVDSVQEVTLRLGDIGGSLRGSVLSPDGEPVVGARVRVGSTHQNQGQGADGRTEETPPPQSLVTDEQGRFETLGLDLGVQPIVISADGFARLTQSVEIRAGVVAEESYQLGVGVTVSGRILDPSGVNAANVVVSALIGSRSAGMGVRTGPDGGYTLNALPVGKLTLQARKDGVGFAEHEVEGEEGSVLTWSARLDALPAISGVVVDKDGNPQAGWSIRGSSLTKGRMQYLTAKSDAEGQFIIKDCQAKSYHVSAHKFPTGEGSGLIINAQEHEVGAVKAGTEDLRIVVAQRAAPTAFVIGKVVLANGDPARSAALSFWPKGVGRSQGFDVDGRTGQFRLGPVPPGNYKLSYSAPNHAEARIAVADLLDSETRDLGTLCLPLGGRLVVKLVNAPKIEKQGDFYLSTRPVKSGARLGLPVRGSDVESGPLTAGDYFLEVGGLKVANYQLPFTIADGGMAHLKVNVRRGVRQQFHPTDIPAGVSVKNLRLSITDAQGLSVADSRFYSKDKSGSPMRVLGVVPDGPYSIEVYEVGDAPSGRALLRKEFSITASAQEQYVHKLSLK